LAIFVATTPMELEMHKKYILFIIEFTEFIFSLQLSLEKHLLLMQRPNSKFLLHLFSFKTPTLWAVMSGEGVAYCASLMRNGVREGS